MDNNYPSFPSYIAGDFDDIAKYQEWLNANHNNGYRLLKMTTYVDDFSDFTRVHFVAVMVVSGE